MKIILPLFLCLFTWPNTAWAVNINPIFHFALETGGDSLQTRASDRNYDLNAGDGMLFSIGTVQHLTEYREHNFELQASIGYRFFFDRKDNDSGVDSEQIPIELLYFYRNTHTDWRLGYGMTHYISNKTRGSGVHTSESRNFKPSTGFTCAIEKVFTESPGLLSWGLGLKATFRSLESDSGEKINGNSFGFYLNMSLI